MENTQEDVISYAVQLGRLDFVSLLLGVVAILIAVSAIYFFISLKNTAKKEAKKVAEEIAPQIAERTANKYIQSELFDILREHSYLFNNSLNDESADRIAETQDTDGKNT